MVSKKKAAKRTAPKKATAKASIKMAAAPAPRASKSATAPVDCCNSSFCGIRCCCPVFGIVTTCTFWMATALSFVVIAAFDLWAVQFLTSLPINPTPLAPIVLIGQVATAAIYSALVLLMGRTNSWWGGFITGVLASAPVALPLALLGGMALIAPIGAILLKGGLVGVAATAVTRCNCK